MAHYGKPEYWDERYTKDTDQFDWYQRYAGVKDILTKKLKTNHAILNIGCGNSRLSEEMYDDGYQNITNIDISQVVINQMIEKTKEKYSNLKFKKMDVRELELPNESFDIVIDKGTLDAILCGDNAAQNAELMLKEVYRVLAPTGIYICITYGIPEQREMYFKTLNWALETNQVKKPNIFSTPLEKGEDAKKSQFHYIYVLEKKTEMVTSEEAKKSTDEEKKETSKEEKA
jgi:ubiquinone/menaquinone biosynthesis C-methylase UbiE